MPDLESTSCLDEMESFLMAGMVFLLSFLETNTALENGWFQVGRLLSFLGRPIFKCYVSFREGNDVAVRSFVDSHSFGQFSCSNFNWFGGDD